MAQAPIKTRFPERKARTMKNLFEAATVQEVKQRLAHLRPDSARQWGKMNAAQAVAHCAAGLELALGDRRPPRMFIGRVLGPMVKPKTLRGRRTDASEFADGALSCRER
jgi:hypothetical protein